MRVHLYAVSRKKEIRRKDMIAIGCDHGGYELKLEVIKHLKERGFEIKD